MGTIDSKQSIGGRGATLLAGNLLSTKRCKAMRHQLGSVLKEDGAPITKNNPQKKTILRGRLKKGLQGRPWNIPPPVFVPTSNPSRSAGPSGISV